MNKHKMIIASSKLSFPLNIVQYKIYVNEYQHGEIVFSYLKLVLAF